MRREAKLINVHHYYDTSWTENGSPSTQISYLTPAGRPKKKNMYGVGFWTIAQAEAWLEGQYRPRLTNLFGLMAFI